MAIDSTPSQVATNALQSIPFGSIIGSPLKACIEAQAMAARTSWEFINEVGLNVDPETGEKKAINVSFMFLQNGRMAQLNVPLLTIVPIPYIAVQTIDINFKANISASSSSVSEQSSETLASGSLEAKGGIKKGPFHLEAKLNASYSSKKDSKATQESKYSVEYTMDVAVKAAQDSMPAGLAKVLELLGNSLDVSEPGGTLEVNQTAFTFKGEPVQLIATYKNSEGLFAPADIRLTTEGQEEQKGTVDGSNVVFKLDKEGKYVIKGGEKTIEITVTKETPGQD
ncbi:MAG: DUF2589 domain-containing protein [Tannerellaceae bacterium]|nr:DUF2589 domain-containing protein [Tannerellaceae bacterium]